MHNQVASDVGRKSDPGFSAAEGQGAHLLKFEVPTYYVSEELQRGRICQLTFFWMRFHSRCHLQLNRRLARGCSPWSLQLNAKNFCNEIVDQVNPYLVYDLTAKSLSHLAGHDRGAMAGAFRQEDVIRPFKDPKGGEAAAEAEAGIAILRKAPIIQLHCP